MPKESTAGYVDAVEQLLLILASEQLTFGANVEEVIQYSVPDEAEREAIEYSVCTEGEYSGPAAVVYSAGVSVVAQLWIA